MEQSHSSHPINFLVLGNATSSKTSFREVFLKLAGEINRLGTIKGE